MNTTRTEKSTVMASFSKFLIPLDFTAQCRLSCSEREKWLMFQFFEKCFRLFLTLNLCLYINKYNRLLIFSTYIKTGIGKIYCLIFFQLYFSPLTCRRDISFKNFLRTFLGSFGIAGYCLKKFSNSIWIHTKSKTGFVRIYVPLFPISKLRPLKNP